MKKQISLLLMVFMLCSIFVIPVSANTTIDYSCYEGNWRWDAGDGELQIKSCTDTNMSFYFRYGQFAIDVTNAKVDGTNVYGEYYEVWDDNLWDNYVISGNFNISLGDSGIWVDWTSSENGSAPSTNGMMFNKPGFVLRYIDTSTSTIPPYDYSSFIGAWKNDTLFQEISVLNVHNNKMDLNVNGNFFENIPIINNQVEIYSKTSSYDVAYDDYYKLTFNDDSIHLLYSYPYRGVGEMLYYEYWLTSDNVIPRKIEAGDYSVTLNGQKLEFDQQPVMVNDRIMVPIRKVFEAMNIDVYFATGETQDGLDFPIVTAIKENTRVTLYVDPYSVNGNSWIMKKGKLTDNGDLQNDNEIQIYTQPIILNGRTLVPVRAITEAFGANVNWDGSTQTVIITGDTSGQRKSDEEIKRVDEFDSKAACNIAKGKYYVFYAYEWPGYDSKGKYYTLSVSDNGTQNGNQSSIKVYIDGTIVEED